MPGNAGASAGAATIPEQPTSGGGATSGFTTAQAARLSGCSESQLGHWRRNGLLVPSDARPGALRYTFRDLVAARVVGRLLDAGLPTARIRRATETLLTSGDDLAAVRLVTDGTNVWACHDDGEILDALRAGQLALFVGVGDFVAEVDAEVRAFEADRRAFVNGLAADEGDETVSR